MEENKEISFEGNTPAQAIHDIAMRTSYSFNACGEGGTGKTALIKFLDEKMNIVTVAPTGIAAKLINGTTIHSRFNFSPDLKYPDKMGYHRLAKKNEECLKYCDAIILDEASMVSPGIIDCMSKAMQILHENDAPFGGTRVFFFNDMFQLTTIIKKEEQEEFYKRYESPFFFASNAYKELDPIVINLEINYRQSDPLFIDSLRRIRIGEDIDEAIKLINQKCYKKQQYEKVYG